MSLTPAQSFAVNYEGDIALIAIPGSGKTHTLVARAVHILKKSYTSICMVTFTRSAAAEMKERIKAAGGDMRRVHCSTFHSICIQMLRRSNIPAPKIISPYQAFAYYKRIKENHAPDGMKERDLREVIDYYASMKEPMDDGSNGLFYLYKEYKRMLQEDHLMDFHDVLRMVVHKLEQETIECLDVTHIMFDEFQDANPFMLYWLQAHYNQGVELTVVGDDDQAIYASFARSLGMKAFKAFKSFPDFVEPSEPMKFINLDLCFRCPQIVLNYANALIKHNDNRLPKELRAFSDRKGSVQCLEFHFPEDELDSIIRHVLEAPNDWAILARTNKELEPVEAAFDAYGIPYYKKSKDSLWENEVAGFLIGLIQMANKDMSMLTNVFSFIGATEEQLEHLKHSISSYADLRSIDETPLHPILIELLHDIRRWTNNGTVTDVLNDAETFLKTNFYASNNRIKGIAPVLLKVLRSFNANNLTELLKIVEKLAMGQTQTDNSENNGATLMTMHSSKGLQWPNVWIINLVQGGCPSKQAMDEGDYSEERRLLYVAFTRAETNLVLSYPGKIRDGRCKGGVKKTDRSVFLDECEIEIKTIPSRSNSDQAEEEMIDEAME